MSKLVHITIKLGLLVLEGGNTTVQQVGDYVNLCNSMHAMSFGKHAVLIHIRRLKRCMYIPLFENKSRDHTWLILEHGFPTL